MALSKPKERLVPSKPGFHRTKNDEMVKRVGYSDYSCIGLFCANLSILVSYLVICRFSCLLYFPGDKFTLVIEAIVMFWVYFDSLVFFLVHSLSNKKEPTCFLDYDH